MHQFRAGIDGTHRNLRQPATIINLSAGGTNILNHIRGNLLTQDKKGARGIARTDQFTEGHKRPPAGVIKRIYFAPLDIAFGVKIKLGAAAFAVVRIRIGVVEFGDVTTLDLASFANGDGFERVEHAHNATRFGVNGHAVMLGRFLKKEVYPPDFDTIPANAVFIIARKQFQLWRLGGLGGQTEKRGHQCENKQKIAAYNALD